MLTHLIMISRSYAMLRELLEIKRTELELKI